jgi:ubiquinone/menaquinone biosynthesis C-methylase UbiE
LAATAFPQPAHHRHPPRSAEEYARVLNDPKREAWQKPQQVVKALGLRESETIADIGAGSGYFARRFTPHVSKVYAVDIDEKLLKMAEEDAPANLETIVAAPDDPRLPEDSVDTIFFCNVLHHIEKRPAYYDKLLRALRPEGRIVMIDFYKRELPVGPPVSMKLSPEEVIAELEAAGFCLAKTIGFLPHQYFLVFERE